MSIIPAVPHLRHRLAKTLFFSYLLIPLARVMISLVRPFLKNRHDYVVLIYIIGIIMQSLV